MSGDDDSSAFACKCLNIRLYRRKENLEDSQSRTGASADYQPLHVGDDGIKISHNELTLRTRSAVSNDSSSPTGRTQQTVVTCLVCDIAAYRIKADVLPDSDAKEGPVIPTEDWAEHDTLVSKSGVVEVHTGKGGCITGEEIKRAISSSTYSRCFSLSLPSVSHALTTSPPPMLPLTRLAIPEAHTFLPSLSPFLPPPPFTPSHPIFLHLSSIVTESSNDARRQAEKRVEEFARQQLSSLEEHETNLKSQLEHLWRIVKEAVKNAERERDASLFSSLQSRRRSMSPRQDSSGTGGVGSPVVRNFVPSTFHAPRATNVHAARHSTLSASLATTTFHHPRAQQNENAAQSESTTHVERPTYTPSTPPYTSNSSSSGSSSGSAPSPVGVINFSRSMKRNMDQSNDIAATYRWYSIEEQEAERRKVKAKIEREKKIMINGSAKEAQGSNKAMSDTHSIQWSSPPTTKTKGGKSKVDSKGDPRKKDGRRKVTFNVEPDIVTIKRDITAEADSDRVPEKGEDLLFDMDGIEPGAVERKDAKPVEDTQNEVHASDTIHEIHERPQRATKRQNDIIDAALPQSFAALRPSSLPAPSHVRPPMPPRINQPQRDLEPASSSSSGSASSSKARDITRRPSEGSPSQEVLSPEQRELLKRVAADSPSHRGLWRPGSAAWKIFDRKSGEKSAILEEEEDELSDNADINGTKEEDVEWQNYRRPDIAGSLPIPMAPIVEIRPGGAASLQPKTSLADRPGTLIPPIPPVAEESEDGKEKSAASKRKQVYAERNTARGLDPGVLDFIEEDDGEDVESPDRDVDINLVSASRSRQHALNIIKARNSVPPEGLWRSLA